jgi:ribonucleoside-diphosphate reductase alpha chain
LTAHEIGCRGITIYRDGSREKQVLEVKKESSYYDKLDGTSKTTAASPDEEIEATPSLPIGLKPRPEVLNGRTHRVTTPLGTAFVSINEDDDGNIFEVFINVGRAGSDITADAEAIGRLISLTFRIPSNYSSDQVAMKVISQLRGIGGSSSTGFGANRVRSLADAVAKAIEQHQATKVVQEPVEESTAPETASLFEVDNASELDVQTDLCPECGSASLRFIEGCQKCELCGFSKC